MDVPTPDEIERVTAWQREQQRQSTQEWLRTKEGVELVKLNELAEKLVGRRIESIGGEQDHADWRSLELHLSDGTHVRVTIDGFADPLELDIEVSRGC